MQPSTVNQSRAGSVIAPFHTRTVLVDTFAVAVLADTFATCRIIDPVDGGGTEIGHRWSDLTSTTWGELTTVSWGELN